MRRTLVLLTILAFSSASARAEGPDETRTSTPPATAAPPSAPPPAATPAPAPAPAPVAAAPVGGLAPDEELVPNPPKKWGFAFLGAAAGCALIAIGTGAAALAKVGAHEGSVASPPTYTRDLQSDARAGRDLATVSYAFAGVAGALAIIDAVVWFEILRKPKVVKKASAWLGPQGVKF